MPEINYEAFKCCQEEGPEPPCFAEASSCTSPLDLREPVCLATQQTTGRWTNCSGIDAAMHSAVLCPPVHI